VSASAPACTLVHLRDGQMLLGTGAVPVVDRQTRGMLHECVGAQARHRGLRQPANKVGGHVGDLRSVADPGDQAPVSSAEHG